MSPTVPRTLLASCRVRSIEPAVHQHRLGAGTVAMETLVATGILERAERAVSERVVQLVLEAVVLVWLGEAVTVGLVKIAPLRAVGDHGRLDVDLVNIAVCLRLVARHVAVVAVVVHAPEVGLSDGERVFGNGGGAIYSLLVIAPEVEVEAGSAA